MSNLDPAPVEPRTSSRILRHLRFFDFGIRNFRFLILFTAFLTLSSVHFSPYTISVDGFSYLKSAEVLFTADFPVYYTWIREPGYPIFVKALSSAGGLLLLFFAQGVLISTGILTTTFGVYKILKIESVSWKTFASSGLAVILVAGYASTILQQASFIFFFGVLVLIISRIVVSQRLSWPTALMAFVLILITTLTAVFIGMAMALAIFTSLVFSGVFKPKILATLFLVTTIPFALVMVPWLEIKSSQAPVGSGDSLSIGSNQASVIIENFNPGVEVFQLFQTQAALLNMGGEMPPTSGLGLAGENIIFGSPHYSVEHACGRFLFAGPADALWGPIETTYQDRCVSPRVLTIISVVNYKFYFFYPIVGLALVFSLLLSIRIFPILRPIVIPAFAVMSPYLLLDASISRYGALVIPLGCILLFHLLTARADFPASAPIRHEKIWVAFAALLLGLWVLS